MMVVSRHKLSRVKYKNMTNSYISQNWGYLLIGQVSKNLIHILEGEEALDIYSGNRQLQERAKDLIFTLSGEESCLFYVRRFNIDQHDNRREIWTLTLATDQNHFDFTSRLNQFPQLSQLDKQKTLQLWGTSYQDNSGCLGIYKICLVANQEGGKDAFSVPFYINLFPDQNREIGIPREAFNQIVTQPFWINYVPIETQIQRWKEFFNVEERLVESKQFCVRFSSHNLLNIGDNNRITFTIDENYARGINSNRLSNSLTSEELWQRIYQAQAKGKDITSLKDINQLDQRNSGRKLGRIERIRQDKNDIRIKIQSDLLRRFQEEVSTLEEDELTLSPEAYLIYKDNGSLSQIKRKDKALEKLKNCQTQNINLGNFFFDATQARPIQQEIVLNHDDLLLQNANEG
jgi:hypothetical protein